MVKLQFLQNYSRRSSPAVDFKAGDICTTIPIDEIEKLIDSGIAKPISHLEELEQRLERKRAKAERIANATGKFVD